MGSIFCRERKNDKIYGSQEIFWKIWEGEKNKFVDLEANQKFQRMSQ